MHLAMRMTLMPALQPLATSGDAKCLSGATYVCQAGGCALTLPVMEKAGDGSAHPASCSFDSQHSTFKPLVEYFGMDVC